MSNDEQVGVTEVALQHSGDAVVGGYFDGEMRAGETSLSGGPHTGFLLGVSRDRAVTWARVLPFKPEGIAVDTLDNVVVIGRIDRTPYDFGNGPRAGIRPHDTFVVKYDSSGAPVWSTVLGDKLSGSKDGFLWGKAVAVDADGCIFVTGGTRDRGTVMSGSDFLLLKLSEDGAHRWGRVYPGGDNLSGIDVDIAPDRSAVVVGYLTNDASVGGDVLIAGKHGAFVAKYLTTGAHVWSQSVPSRSNGSVAFHSTAISSSGEIYTVGVFENEIDFGEQTLFSAGDADILVAAFEADGVPRWARRFGGARSDVGSVISIDTMGNLAVGGTYQGRVNLGGGRLDSEAGGNLFVARYGRSGDHLWSQGFPGARGKVHALETDTAGYLWVGGFFRARLPVREKTYEAQGFADGFVARFRQ